MNIKTCPYSWTYFPEARSNVCWENENIYFLLRQMKYLQYISERFSCITFFCFGAIAKTFAIASSFLFAKQNGIIG